VKVGPACSACLRAYSHRQAVRYAGRRTFLSAHVAVLLPERRQKKSSRYEIIPEMRLNPAPLPEPVEGSRRVGAGQPNPKEINIP